MTQQEPLGQQHGEVLGQEPLELVRRSEGLVRDRVVRSDGLEERGQSRLAVRRWGLEVHQPRQVAVGVREPARGLAHLRTVLRNGVEVDHE